LQEIDMDLRGTLCGEMVLAGGNTQFSGFPERFLLEMRKTLSSNLKLRVLAKQPRDTLCWEGGVIYANLSSAKNQWMTRAEYLERGSSISTSK
jgi:actin-related protein